MPNIEENSDSQLSAQQFDPRDMVTIGNGQRVSLRLVRDVYKELTKKADSISRSYGDAVQINLRDIEQLHFKVGQACQQYHIEESNFLITIFYVNNTSERFNSFDEFLKYNAGQTSPVENILVKYEFLVKPPQHQKPQTYAISVRLVSRLAIQSRMREDLFGAPPKIIRLMGDRTARIEIEYVDYMIARTLLGLIEDWFKVLTKAPEKRVIELLQSKSHLIPRAARFITVIVSSWSIAELLPYFIPMDDSNLQIFGEFALYSCLSIYVFCNIAQWSAQFLENAIDSWTYLSFIHLNRGDENEIEKAKSENRVALIKGFVSGILSIAINIVVKVSTTLIISHFGISR